MSKLTKKKRKPVPVKRTKYYIYLLILIAIPLILNWRNIGYGFTTIDDSAIIDNNYGFLKDFNNVFKTFQKDNFMSDGGVNYYRPVQTVSFMIDTQMNSDIRNVYHLSNIIYHILTVIVLFFLLLKLDISIDLSFYLSLLFSVHPLLTNAIAWIPGRGDLLAGLFCTTSFLFFLYYGSTKNKIFIFLSSFAFLLALFSKEVSVILPGILIYSYWFVQKNKYKIRELVPFILIWSLSILLFFYLRHLYIFSRMELSFRTFISNLPVIPIFWGKLFLPFSLSPLPVYSLLFIIIGFIIIILSFVYIKYSKQVNNSLIFLGIIWFIGFIIPAMFVKVQIEKIYFEYLECRAYLPSIGIFIVLGVLINEVIKLRGTKIIIRPFVVATLVFAVISYNYSEDFSDPTAYFSSLIKSNPDNSYAFNQRGCIHYSQNEIDLALKDFDNAIKVNPANSDPYYNKGIIYDNLKDYNQAEQSYSAALHFDTLSPKSNRLYENVYVSLSLVELSLKKYDEAAKISKIGIVKYPAAFYLYKNLGQAYYNNAKYDSALQQIDRAIALKPDYKEAYLLRGMTKMNLTNYEASIPDFNYAINLDPQYGEAYYFRGLIYSKLNKQSEAGADLKKSLELGYLGTPYSK
jgi:protein O-mannosyl-transferase